MMRNDGVQQGELFTKMYHGIRNGMAAAMGADLWHAYSILATYMDRDGRCYPSQEQLARNMGIRRDAVSKRMKRLCEFKWHGEHLVTMEKQRQRGSKFANTVYYVNPNFGFRIFVESDDDPSMSG